MLMSAHDGGVDHHVFVVGIACQQLENALENAALRPSAKALVHNLPVAKSRVQITPGDPFDICKEPRRRIGEVGPWATCFPQRRPERQIERMIQRLFTKAIK